MDLGFANKRVIVTGGSAVSVTLRRKHSLMKGRQWQPVPGELML